MNAAKPKTMNKLKNTLIALSCGLLLTAAARAQDTNAPRTELDAFEGSVGVVIVRGSADIGVVNTENGAVSVRCKQSIEPRSGRKLFGLAITLTGKDGVSDTTIVDYAELESLVNGLDFLGTANWSMTSLPNFDAVYTTRDGLVVSAYSSQRQPGTLGASLKSARAAKVRVALGLQDFAQFRGLIQQAKGKLDTIKTGQ